MNFMQDYLLDSNTYVVKPNDSLFKIAKMYDCTVDEIKNANFLATDMIYPGQVLYIPKTTKKSYTTKDTDTFGFILRKYHIDTSKLKELTPFLDLLVADNQVIDEVTNSKRETLTYMGEDVREFLANNNLSALELLEMNKDKWLAKGSSVRVS